jgi:hypothetical protein
MAAFFISKNKNMRDTSKAAMTDQPMPQPRGVD